MGDRSTIVVLNSQLDLNNAIQEKVNISAFNTFTGSTGNAIGLSYWTGTTEQYTGLTKNNLTVYYVL